MKKQNGFTLIELLLVVGIVAIIAAIAIPSFSEQVRKSRRAECGAGLTGLASAMERFHTINSTYLGAADGGNDTGAPAVYATTCPIDGGTPVYNLTISAATASTYTLQAAPTDSQADDKCGNLTLTNRGLKGISVDDDDLTWQDCW